MDNEQNFMMITSQTEGQLKRISGCAGRGHSRMVKKDQARD